LVKPTPIRSLRVGVLYARAVSPGTTWKLGITLIINNDDVARLLTIEESIEVLEQSYRDLAIGEATCRPRINIRIPTSDPAKNYQFGSMEGGSAGGYFAVRMKSDVIYETSYNGAITQEKYCMRPGLFCGLIFLTSVETGEPLAFINDGVLQHMRVVPTAPSASLISPEISRHVFLDITNWIDSKRA
jgi:ornithine cyclodeaminase/alanine dehydrogenase-like protein (mu-crystallin family)